MTTVSANFFPAFPPLNRHKNVRVNKRINSNIARLYIVDYIGGKVD